MLVTRDPHTGRLLAKNPYHQEVLDALQNLEEMGGVEDHEEYLMIMHSLKRDLEQRIEAARMALEEEE